MSSFLPLFQQLSKEEIMPKKTTLTTTTKKKLKNCPEKLQIVKVYILNVKTLLLKRKNTFTYLQEAFEIP